MLILLMLLELEKKRLKVKIYSFLNCYILCNLKKYIKVIRQLNFHLDILMKEIMKMDIKNKI